MNIAQFEQLVMQLRERPIPGKRIFVWTGNRSSLQDTLPKDMTRELSISDLLLDKHDSISEARIRTALRRGLNKELETYRSTLTDQQVLVVSGAELLARYNIGLGPFYDYYVSDRTIVILFLPSLKMSYDAELCSYFEFDQNAVLEYFKHIVEQDDNVFLESHIIAKTPEEEELWLNLG